MTVFKFAEKGAEPSCTFQNTAEAFEGLVDDEYRGLARSIFALRRGPVRFRRDQTIVLEGEASEYIFLVISGVVRSFKSFEDGTRNIFSFYFPREFFGLTNHSAHLLSADAATDATILFFKRSALDTVAKRECQIAHFLLTLTLNELQRMQERSLLINRDAQRRVASFLIDLSKRMGMQTDLDLPMSHRDIADHLGLTIETLSRVITLMENSGVIARGRSCRNLILHSVAVLERIAS